MNLRLKKVVVLLSIVAALPIAMVGCKKTGGVATCKNDADCRVDASGTEINGVCYMGKCEECAEDSHCSDLKQCVNNRCLSTCQADADCGANSHCDKNFCVSDCSEDVGCSSGEVCAQGRCVAMAGSGGSMVGQSLENVHFDFDKFNIKPEDQARVAKVAEFLKANPSARITVTGHADKRGTESYNLALGDRRSKSVQSELVGSGIAANRINTVSYGHTQPVIDENNEYAWQQNRRAEFIVEGN
ncbi:MAG TPA: OmpA family protein [Myxococcota bacterium]|nr:OmpA family protein [Myxococcota bacterium]